MDIECDLIIGSDVEVICVYFIACERDRVI